MPLDLSKYWDFNNPEISEERFRSALPMASPEDALILQTQIARTFGLRRDFDRARKVLEGIHAQVESAGSEAQVRWHLEWGRTCSSATHPPETQTPKVKEQARRAFLRAFDLAQAAGLDELAIDALHMMTFVDTQPADQLAWNRKAEAVMQASDQPGAKKWEASLLNNTGYALYLLGRYEEALDEFQQALAVRERDGSPQAIRIAYWMIAWTLRAMGRLDDAIAIQLRLEEECDAAGEPDPYVFEELEILYRALGDEEKAAFYAARRQAAG